MVSCSRRRESVLGPRSSRRTWGTETFVSMVEASVERVVEMPPLLARDSASRLSGDRMVWSENRPRLDGFYFCRTKDDRGKVHVFVGSVSLKSQVFTSAYGTGHIPQMNCEWAGPIFPPDDF